MKILAIRIKNLASLDGESSIDFTSEPLVSAGIFAITGPTGAGKSTILDALCLGLYAKTPRYVLAKESGVDVRDVNESTISQGDIRGILRRGTADGFAQVDFVGIDGNPHQATWAIKRARSKAEGALQAYSFSLKNLRTQTDFQGTKTEVLAEAERLVGLNFDQFTRSVLLAQGDFTAFLRADKNEKSGLLEKLTGTQVYSEISKRIFERHRDETAKLHDLNLQKEGILTLRAEEKEVLLQQKAELTQEIQQKEKEKGELSKEISWHEQLTVLESSQIKAGEHFQLAQNVKTEASDRERKLRQAEGVQSARSSVDGLRIGKEQIEQKADVITKLEAKLVELRKQKESTELLRLKTEVEVTTSIKNSDEAQPLIESAKALDIQIREKEGQLKQAVEELNLAKEAEVLLAKQAKEEQDKSAELVVRITELTAWKKENVGREAIANHQPLIVSKLTDAQKLLDRIKSADDRIKEQGEKETLAIREKEKLNSQFEALKLSWQEEGKRYTAELEKLHAIPLANLEEEKLVADRTLEEIIQAEAHWKVLFSVYQAQEQKQKALTKTKKEIQSKQKLLKEAGQTLGTAKSQRETSQRMLEKARITSTESVESLRAGLVENEPCPVCGSTAHALHNLQLDNVLAELEKEHALNEAAYDKAIAAHSSLEESCTQLQKSAELLALELLAKETESKSLTEDWRKFRVTEQSEGIADHEKEAWLKQLIQKQKSVQQQLNEQIQAYYKQKEALEKEGVKLGQSEKQLAEWDNTRKDTDRLLQTIEEQQNRQKQELEKAGVELDELRKELSVYFTATNWFEQWKKGPETFVQSIVSFAQRWKDQIRLLEENTIQQGLLLAAIEGIQQNLERQKKEVGIKEKVYLGLKEQFEALTAQRKLIFGGEDLMTIESGLKKAITDSQTLLETHKSGLTNLNTELTRLATQKDGEENNLLALQKQVAGYTEKIEAWLKAYNERNGTVLDEHALNELLSLPPEWIENEQTALQQVNENLTQARTVLQERNQKLEEHKVQRISEKEIFELQELMEQVQNILTETNKGKNEIEFKVLQDEVNRQRIGGLLKTIDAQSLVKENWAKLNDIIGSADGKKFRQVAQEYTLDVLLGYANVHLDMLSQRYVLERIPASLGLQVLDRDMGNEVRTVFSLSGGESFLVSLALALALASLSSSRMQVESLFIDEGFGSLDPNTLNIAMDALERLHNQGRKVGVISHVQEMTERIPVQIKVSKMSGGRSKVEVVG